MPDVIRVPHGTALGFDFGEARIGVATGDAEVGMAHPVQTVVGNSNEAKFALIEQLVREWQPVYFAVGLPVYMDGTEHELTRLARKFGHRLHARFGLPVYWVDERLSSVYAEGLLAEAGVFGQKRKAVLDQVAAQAIMHSLFESGACAYFNGRSGEAG